VKHTAFFPESTFGSFHTLEIEKENPIIQIESDVVVKNHCGKEVIGL